MFLHLLKKLVFLVAANTGRLLFNKLSHFIKLFVIGLDKLSL